eukprot:1056714-Rhodomonas_salina.2
MAAKYIAMDDYSESFAWADYHLALRRECAANGGGAGQPPCRMLLAWDGVVDDGDVMVTSLEAGSDRLLVQDCVKGECAGAAHREREKGNWGGRSREEIIHRDVRSVVFGFDVPPGKTLWEQPADEGRRDVKPTRRADECESGGGALAGESGIAWEGEGQAGDGEGGGPGQEKGERLLEDE